MDKIVLSVKNLIKIFNEKKYFWQFFKSNNYKTIINNISFDLKQGEILGLIGNNGSGKSTIIQILLNTLTPTSGSIKYFGKDLFKFRSEILEKVSFVSNYTKLPAKLTLWQSLNIYLDIYNSNNSGIKMLNKIKEINYYLENFNLTQYKNAKVELLSSGQMLKLMIIKAFITNPKIVLLDEPTSQIDSKSAQQVRDFILKKQKENNLSIILTSHNNDEIDYLCDRILILENGKIYNKS